MLQLQKMKMSTLPSVHRSGAFLDQAWKKGITDGKGKVCLRYLTSEIRTAYRHFDGFGKYQGQLARCDHESLLWLTPLLDTTPGHRATHPVYNVLLANFLFGSIEEMIKKVDALSSVHGPELEQTLADGARVHRGRRYYEMLMDVSTSARRISARTGISVNTVVTDRLASGVETHLRPSKLKPEKCLEILKELRAGKRISEIAQKLEISASSVSRVIARNRALARIEPAPKAMLWRREWERLIRTFGAKGITFCRKQRPGLYASLYRSDRGWLITINKQNAQIRGPVNRVDWPARDKLVLHSIEASLGGDTEQGAKRRSKTSLIKWFSFVNCRNIEKMPDVYRFLWAHTKSRPVR